MYIILYRYLHYNVPKYIKYNNIILCMSPELRLEVLELYTIQLQSTVWFIIWIQYIFRYSIAAGLIIIISRYSFLFDTQYKCIGNSVIFCLFLRLRNWEYLPLDKITIKLILYNFKFVTYYNLHFYILWFLYIFPHFHVFISKLNIHRQLINFILRLKKFTLAM